MNRRTVILRALALLSALGPLAVLAGTNLRSAVEAALAPQRTVDLHGADILVLYLLQLGLLVLCAWCALCVVLLAAASLRPSIRLGRLTTRLTPRSGHRILAAALGIGTLTLAACGAPSDPSPTALPSTTPTYAASSDAFDWALAHPGAPSPETTSEPQNAADGVGSGGGVTPSAEHLVSAGDCLWDIAGTLLGPTATPAEIAYLVDDLYQANQAVIGENPDLLPAGTTLVVPHA